MTTMVDDGTADSGDDMSGSGEHGHGGGATPGQDPAGHDRAGHQHGAALSRSGAAARRPLTIALALSLLTFVIQIVVGVWSGSLSLLTDSAHVLTDSAGIFLALAAVTLASRPTGAQRTFGLYRLEVLSALANAVILLAVAAWAIVEAIGRISDPPDVPGAPVLIVGAIGLVTNVIALRLLSGGESIVAAGARLEVLADTIGSIGVIIGGALIAITGRTVIDAWVGLAIGVWIVPRSIRLAADALRILLQSAPPGVDVDALAHDLAGVPDVVDVHDMHVWTLTSDMEVLTAHVMVSSGADTHAVLDRARQLLSDKHGIHHATLQVEPDDHTGCAEVDW
jgi:cobalt-zinc-cadmium efflux system protein